jgi:hypothetical protein
LGKASVYFTYKEICVFMDVKIYVGLSRGVFNARCSEYLANLSVRRLSLGICKLTWRNFLNYIVGVKCFLTRFCHQFGGEAITCLHHIFEAAVSIHARETAKPGCSVNLFSSFIRHECQNSSLRRTGLFFHVSLQL